MLQIFKLFPAITKNKKTKLGLDMTLLTHAEYEESLHSPVTKYTCQKTGGLGFGVCNINSNKEKAFLTP